MRKDEFLTRLKEAVSGMEADTASEILEDYERHFQFGEKQGRTQEEICEELGDIEELAEALREENNRVSNNRQGNPTGSNMTQENARQTNTTQTNTTQTNTTQTNITLTNIVPKDTGLENPDRKQCFVESDTQKEQEKTTCSEGVVSGKELLDGWSATGISSIHCQLQYSDLCVKPSRDGQTHIEIDCCDEEDREKVAVLLQADVSGGQLNLQEKKAKVWWKHRDNRRELNRPDDDSDSFYTNFSCRIRIAIPEEVHELTGKNVNGDVRLEKVTLNSGVMTTTNGDLTGEGCTIDDYQGSTVNGDNIVKNCVCNQLSANTTNGDLRIDNCRSADHLRVKSLNGDLQVVNCIIGEEGVQDGGIFINEVHDDKKGADWDLWAETMAGDVHLDGNRAVRLHARSTSGDVFAKVTETASTELISTSGDVSATLPAGINGCVRSVSGDCKISMGERSIVNANSTTGNLNISCNNQGKGYRADLHTVSGHIRVQYQGQSKNAGKGITETFGAGDCNVTAHTVSGSVTLAG